MEYTVVTPDVEAIQKKFPIGMQMGIKQPYMKISFSGKLSLRNDNSANVIFLTSAAELKEKGNAYFKQSKFPEALKYFK